MSYPLGIKHIQTWQWKIHYLQVIFLWKTPFLVDFQLPRLITGWYCSSKCWTFSQTRQLPLSNGTGAILLSGASSTYSPAELSQMEMVMLTS